MKAAFKIQNKRLKGLGKRENPPEKIGERNGEWGRGKLAFFRDIIGDIIIMKSIKTRGKAGGHEPLLFPLSCHKLAFFSSGSHKSPLFPLPVHHIWLFLGQNYFFK